MKTPDLSQQLELYYQSAVSNFENEKAFFICVADYIKFIGSKSQLTSTVERLLDSNKEQNLELLNLEKLVIEEVEAVLEELKDVIKKKKIKSDKIRNVFLEIQKYEEGKMTSTESKPQRLFNEAREIISELYHLGKIDQDHKYFKYFPDSNEIESYTFSKSYLQYCDEVTTTRYLSEFSLGTAWNDLIWVYQTTYDIKDLSKFLKKDGDANATVDFLWFVYHDRFKAMQKILDSDRSDDSKVSDFFNVKRHKLSLVRIHNFLQCELRFEGKIKNKILESSTGVFQPHEPKPIYKVQIMKGKSKYTVLINGTQKYFPVLRNPDERKNRYWDIVFDIAVHGKYEGDPKPLKSIANYLNGKRNDNPLFQRCNLVACEWVVARGIYLEAGDKVIIEEMKEKTYKEKFK